MRNVIHNHVAIFAHVSDGEPEVFQHVSMSIADAEEQTTYDLVERTMDDLGHATADEIYKQGLVHIDMYATSLTPIDINTA